MTSFQCPARFTTGLPIELPISAPVVPHMPRFGRLAFLRISVRLQGSRQTQPFGRGDPMLGHWPPVCSARESIQATRGSGRTMTTGHDGEALICNDVSLKLQ